MDDLISRQAAIDAHYEYCNKHPDAGFPVWSLKILEDLPPAQPDSKELSSTHKALDTVSRQAVIEAINKIFPADPMRDDYTQGITCGAALANIYVAQLPSAQPEPCEDTISRQAAIDSMCELMRHWFGCDSKDEIREIKRELGKLPSAQPEQTNSWCINSWCIDCKEYDTENKCCPRYNRVIKQTLDDAYRHGETEAEARYHAQQRWIPCSERLPEKEEQVLIYAWNVHYVLAKYREIRTCDGVYKMAWVTEDAYSTPREIKHEVICWMPLPEPYQAERRTDERSD